ncbi:MAG: glycosyltransferase family 4 protein [Anaerolineae bacterium]|nr:glycosyltransferase family 4 protein [Anaerolineae bacterium]
MNILTLTDLYPPFYQGGYELVCRDVCEWLRAQGHTVTVLTSTFGAGAPVVEGHVHRLLRFGGTQPQGRLGRRLAQLKQFFQSRQNYRITRRLAQAVRPDFAFIWNLQSASILPIFAVQDLGIRKVFQFGSHWLYDVKQEYVDEPSRLRRLYRAGLTGFRRFGDITLEAAVIVSESLKQSYLEAGFDIGQVEIIPNAVRDEWLTPRPSNRGAADDTLRLVYVGRLEAIKGTDVALKAMMHLVNERGCRNIHLDLIGKGEPDYIDSLKQFLAFENLSDFVDFVDFMPLDELMRRYGQYDVLLFPTPRWEGFGLVAIEAMSQGVPVVASDIGGPRDVVEDGKTGFLVTPGDPVALAGAVEKFVKTPALAAQMGAAARETVDRKYRLSVILERYEAFLTAFV